MSELKKNSEEIGLCMGFDNAIHICFGIHDKDGNYSVWAGTTMQSIVENTRSPIVFHILHDDTLNSSNKEKLGLIADNSGNSIEFHHFNPEILGHWLIRWIDLQLERCFGSSCRIFCLI